MKGEITKKNDIIIARALIRALKASDEAKTFNKLSQKSDKNYNKKSIAIKKAIEKISENKNSIFRYSIYSSPQCGGSFIIYFEFDIDDEKYQISFHSPYVAMNIEEYQFFNRLVKRRNYHTKWNGLYGGSREAANILKEVILMKAV
ncbi:MAG: hypothetical protein MJZ37_10590 [Bacilli bacterium]|nr:hypothetical protein [Bacilli bacterium]